MPLDGPISLTVKFYMPVPASISKKKQDALKSKPHLKRPDLDNLLKTADIVVLTLPLTSDNEGFFNNEKFCLMKDSSVFVNIARGKLVNQNHLVSALEQCKIAGAVLDVFEEEPLEESSKLWNFDNVIITPHNSFVGDMNNKRMFDTILTNLEEHVKNEQ